MMEGHGRTERRTCTLDMAGIDWYADRRPCHPLLTGHFPVAAPVRSHPPYQKTKPSKMPEEEISDYYEKRGISSILSDQT